MKAVTGRKALCWSEGHSEACGCPGLLCLGSLTLGESSAWAPIAFENHMNYKGWSVLNSEVFEEALHGRQLVWNIS